MKQKKTITKSAIETLLKQPERHYSLAAAVLTDNYLAGLVIECLYSVDGEPIIVKNLTQMCYCSYSQMRKALTDLEDAGLIEIRTQSRKYVYVDTHPERTPLVYTITDAGLACIGKRNKKKNKKDIPLAPTDHELAKQYGLYVGESWVEEGLFETLLEIVPEDDRTKIYEQYRKEQKKWTH